MRLAWNVLRSAGCWIILTAVTIVLGSLYVPMALVSPDGRAIRRLELVWIWIILRGSNVDLVIEGTEHVEPGRSYIVMANHRSMYDIPAVHWLLARDRDLRWVGKRELGKVPFFGWALRSSRHVLIDRENRRRAIDALRGAAEASEEGVGFVVMPEGTRSVDRSLLRFKKGGFHLAIDTGLPILPVGISGSETMMPKGTAWILYGTIRLEVRPPIPTDGMGKEDLSKLIERTRAEISAALPDLPREEDSTTERSAT